MRRIVDDVPIGVVIVFALAFIYNVYNGGIIEAIKVTVFSIFGIVCAIVLILYAFVIIAWHEKSHLFIEGIIDRITGKKR